ncbi:MAG: type II toxin-antitoxin system HigB family toxin [Legionella sp.]|nr:type II toxin-antitoxin system HigB family toxin [Legionella sp.]
MHIITRRRITEAKALYPHGVSALAGWLKIVEENTFKNFAELKATFNSIDKVGDLYVFDLGGNKLRLIASIHFNRQKLYIRHILTHQKYDKSTWKE